MMTEHVPLMSTGDKPMEERRFGQQEMLERLLKTTDDIREDLRQFTLVMTDRVAKVEAKQDQNISAITALSVVTAKHAESLNWIKGAGFAAVTILSILIVWILNHLMFKAQ